MSFFAQFNNSAASTTRNRRTSSVSLPTRNVASDHYEKPDRHTSNDSDAGSFVQNGAMNHGQRARYIKWGALVTVVLFLFFYLAPSGSSGPSFAPAPGSVGQSPDPATGRRCTRSHDGKKPLVQYALMIDAGSTGSRIHVYRFNNCGTTPELEDEIFEMTAKKEGGSGLSSYKGDAEGAAKSLDVLMDVAVKNVPDNLKACTPVAVKATAGLRKLGPEMSDAILKAVRNRLETVYPFPVVAEENGGVEVMDGKDEGVYAWITTNYLLGKIGGPDKNPTAAVFDLGGGSTQIVFEPTFPTVGGGMPEHLAEGDHKYELNFGGRKFTLYQHSYLGYGLMAAREALHGVVIDAMHEENGSDRSWLEKPVLNPCIAPGMSRDVTVELPKDHALGSSLKVKMTGPKEGAPAQCRALTEKILRKDAECKLHPCAFNGVHQPSLEKTFSREDVYLFSYFYDRTQPLGMPESFTIRELKDLAHRVCQGESSWDVFHSVKGAVDELKGRPESCLDLNFMLSLLHTGYEMPMEREVKIAKKIKGNELGWCLGASLPLLSQESGWQCRIKEVSR
ncbi:Guanosine-diphosphatase [Venturia effusa]|uniref:guanosine-diphosphatase n=1 Tax=Venturia effusa TaxID=50376 RepID=A0A517LND3_9PEZI|nr:Guanosine-diphosphatase [Venturia effusa]